MQQIISFIIRNKYFLLFLILEIVAFIFTIQSHSFHRSKFISSSNSVTGYFYDNFNNFDEYLHLKQYNQQLVDENVKLKNLLSKKNKKNTPTKKTILDSLVYKQKYTFISAKVIKNDFTKSNNFLTLNRGKNDSIKNDLGVITSKGIVGVTANVSNNYSTVMSILNENSKINARLLHRSHFGTLTWNGKNYKTLQLEDLPRQANLKIGDTVITGGKSTIFPEGILVGIIKDFEMENNQYKTVNLELFNDMSAIGYVNIINNLEKTEIINLEKRNE